MLSANRWRVRSPVGKKTKVYFLTGYMEYLFDKKVSSEYNYLADASRFLRYLLSQASKEDVQDFINGRANSDNYARRIRGSLAKFYEFASEHLNVDNNPLK